MTRWTTQYSNNKCKGHTWSVFKSLHCGTRRKSLLLIRTIWGTEMSAFENAHPRSGEKNWKKSDRTTHLHREKQMGFGQWMSLKKKTGKSESSNFARTSAFSPAALAYFAIDSSEMLITICACPIRPWPDSSVPWDPAHLHTVCVFYLVIYWTVRQEIPQKPVFTFPFYLFNLFNTAKTGRMLMLGLSTIQLLTNVKEKLDSSLNAITCTIPTYI